MYSLHSKLDYLTCQAIGEEEIEFDKMFNLHLMHASSL